MSVQHTAHNNPGTNPWSQRFLLIYTRVSVIYLKYDLRILQYSTWGLKLYQDFIINTRVLETDFHIMARASIDTPTGAWDNRAKNCTACLTEDVENYVHVGLAHYTWQIDIGTKPTWINLLSTWPVIGQILWIFTSDVMFL